MVIIYNIDNHLLFVGDDKFENDGLIKYSQRYMKELKTPVYWFHVDNFSSPHAYVRLNEGEKVPPPKLVQVCSQIVKLGSIEGVKRPSTDIIYTLCTNLAKTKSLDVGTVTFQPHSEILYNRAVKNNKQIEKFLSKIKQSTTIPEMEKELNDLIHNAKKKAKAKNDDDFDFDSDDEPKKEEIKPQRLFADMPKDDGPCDNSDDFM